jgi:hypothetical protein
MRNQRLAASGDSGQARPGRPARADAGAILIETMVALALLLIVMAGLLSMDGIATNFTENYGHLAARTAEYAQDKMEQLVVLAYGDDSTDTRVFPATSAGGTGLAVGGSSNPEAPADGYVDYLDVNGNLLASAGTSPPAGWYFKRVWQVTNPSANLKQITVTVTVSLAFGRLKPPASTMTALKTFPF